MKFRRHPNFVSKLKRHRLHFVLKSKLLHILRKKKGKHASFDEREEMLILNVLANKLVQ